MERKRVAPYRAKTPGSLCRQRLDYCRARNDTSIVALDFAEEPAVGEGPDATPSLGAPGLILRPAGVFVNLTELCCPDVSVAIPARP